MSSTKLSAPVGLSPRSSQGNPVQNKAADVKLVRAMLRANGMPSKDSGNVDSELLKLIGLMQKKAGVRPPDQVVDPGGLTYKKMLPAYKKELDELGTGDRYIITHKGKKICISKADKEKIDKITLDHLKKYIDIIDDGLKHNAKICQEWAKMVGGAEGFLRQISSIIVIGVGRVKLPDIGIATKAGAAIKAARSAHGAKDFKALERTIPAAEKAANAMTKDMLRFLSEVGGSAKNVHAALNLSTTVGWMVVGAMATPVLIGAGMGAGGAAVVGSAGVAILQSASNELGRHASGQDVTMGESLKNILVDMLVGAALGKAGTLKPAFVKNIAKTLTPGLAALLEGYVAKEVAEKFIERYLSNTVQSAVVGIITDVITIAKDSIKKGGKCPSEKEIKEKITKRIKDTLLAGPFGELGRFQKAWVHKKKPELITKKLVPDVLKSKFKKAELTERQRRDLQAAVVTGLSKTGTNTVIDTVVGKVNGKPSQSQLLKDAEKTFLNDSKIRSDVEKIISAELKKMKVPAG